MVMVMVTRIVLMVITMMMIGGSDSAYDIHDGVDYDDEEKEDDDDDVYYNGDDGHNNVSIRL